MKSETVQYFKSRDKSWYLVSMITVSAILHAVVIFVLLLKPAHSRNSNIILATAAPVKLVGSIAMPKGQPEGADAGSKPKPSPKTQPNKTSTDEKGPPVTRKKSKTQKSSKPAPTPVPVPPEPDGTSKKSGEKDVLQKKAEENMVPFGAGTGIGQSLGGIIAGSEEFRFNWYIDMITFRIQKVWSPPFEVGKIGKTLKSIVLFEVLRDGTLGQITIEESSGSELMDNAAMNAIKAAFPVEPLPRDFPDSILRLHFYIQHTF